jgi:dihydropteroate synthase
MIRKRFVWKMRDREITLGDRTLIVAILNVTPDSFSDGGRYQDPDRAYARALELELLGADIIDIGAESTRPGSERISEAEELRRLVPVLKRLRGHLSIPLCVDTYKSAVAAKALELGVEIINDPSGLTFDPQLAKVVANADAALILNHMRGTPETWSRMPSLKNPMGAVCNDLAASVHRATRYHVDRMRMVVDPGLGFGKRKEENSRVLAELPQLAKLLDLPVMVGPSRKSFLKQETDLETAFASAAAVVASVLNGAHMVRVHDVKEMAAAARIADNILLAEREIPVETPAPRRKFGAAGREDAGHDVPERRAPERRTSEKPRQDFPRIAPSRPVAVPVKPQRAAPAIAQVTKAGSVREPEEPVTLAEVPATLTGVTAEAAPPVAPTVLGHEAEVPSVDRDRPSGEGNVEAETVREELDEFDAAQEGTGEDQTDLDDLGLEQEDKEEDEDVHEEGFDEADFDEEDSDQEDLDEEDFDAEILAELDGDEDDLVGEDLDEEPASRPAAAARREPAIKLPKLKMPVAAKPAEERPDGKPRGPKRFEAEDRRPQTGRREGSQVEGKERGRPFRGPNRPFDQRGKSDRDSGPRNPKDRDGGGWAPRKRAFPPREETPAGRRGPRSGSDRPFGDRSSGGPASDRSGLDRTGRGRAGGDHPRQGLPGGERPRGSRPDGNWSDDNRSRGGRTGGGRAGGGSPRGERPFEDRGRGSRPPRFDGPRHSPEERPPARGPRGDARKGAFSSKSASTRQGGPPKGKVFDRPFQDRPPKGKFTGKSSGKPAKGKGAKGRPKGFRPGQR